MNIILRKDDFVDASMWEYVLDAAGIETQVLVAGRIIDTEIEELAFTPIECKGFCS